MELSLLHATLSMVTSDPASSAAVAFAVRTVLHGRRHAGSGSTNRVQLRDRSSGGPRGWIGKGGLGDDAELGPSERSG